MMANPKYKVATAHVAPIFLEMEHALSMVACHADCDQFALAQASEDSDEAIAAFFEGRLPRFTGN